MKKLSTKDLAVKILKKCSAAEAATTSSSSSSSSMGTSGISGAVKGPDVTLTRKTKIDGPQVSGPIPTKTFGGMRG